jgi:hypothetical protein
MIKLGGISLESLRKLDELVANFAAVGCHAPMNNRAPYNQFYN